MGLHSLLFKICTFPSFKKNTSKNAEKPMFSKHLPEESTCRFYFLKCLHAG